MNPTKKIKHTRPWGDDSAACYAKVICLLPGGTSPRQAVKKSSPEGELEEKITAGIKGASQETRSRVNAFDRMRDTGAVLAGVVHLLAKYEDDFRPAVGDTVLAGGDFADSGLRVGMVLKAHPGQQDRTEDWQAALKHGSEIAELLNKITDRLSWAGGQVQLPLRPCGPLRPPQATSA